MNECGKLFGLLVVLFLGAKGASHECSEAASCIHDLKMTLTLENDSPNTLKKKKRSTLFFFFYNENVVT